MAKASPTLEWGIVRLGDDHNWWVEELSDTVHWDVDGLSIIDPRQIDHIVELCEPLREYGFDMDDIDTAFIAFRIDKDLGNGRVRLHRVRASFLESEDKMFALPDVVDEENGPYADFLDQITRARVKMLNDLFDFEQKLTVDEVEDQLREEQNSRFMEGKAVHMFDEVVAILDFVPEGWESEDDAPAKADAEEEEEFPDVEDEEDEEKLKGDSSLRWDEDDEDGEKKEGDEDGEAKKKSDDDEDDAPAKPAAKGKKKASSDDDDEDEDDDDEDDDDEDEEEDDDAEEDEAPRARRGRR